jgi:hypothetical protein
VEAEQIAAAAAQAEEAGDDAVRESYRQRHSGPGQAVAAACASPAEEVPAAG